MLIICPSCTSRYEIDAAKIGPHGRQVRCAGCGLRWLVPPDMAQDESAAAVEPLAFPAAPAAADTAAALEEELRRAAITAEVEAAAFPPEPAIMAEPPATRGRAKPPRRRQVFRLSSAGRLLRPVPLAACGLVLLGLAAWQRTGLVRAAPQLAGVFEALGLPVNTRGLKLSGIEAELVEDAQGRFLVVRGDVTNLVRAANTVPTLALAVKDEAGRTLYSWTTEAPRKQLAPAELVHFRARLSAPPEAGASVQVRFAPDAA